ncbi:hypothetical protein O6H91_13G034800 [Diphasiastrum complanatum]|uniref:Uncharacterized protein n=2 Tax=Diphasiastrum complanatum TaxID=34168 RepID=A0ACC2BUB6_DIPCM|nr:hypothetical protein O6H91_13G034800 [Diphasiastrum complanatum]
MDANSKERDDCRERIRAYIHQLPLVDTHAHNLVALDSLMPFVQAFSEAQGEALQQAAHTLCFKRSLRDISILYGTRPLLESIEAHRQKAGLEAISTECFISANISTLLLDDGLRVNKMHNLEWHRKYVPSVHKVLRIEALAEDILNEDPPGGITWTLHSFIERFLAILNSLLEKIVALKSIAAYRSGLNIDPNVPCQDAEAGLMDDLGDRPLRIKNKFIIDFIFVRALEFASLHNIPLQLHSGFGDKDLDLRLANPLHLRSILEDKRFSRSRLVLLHASYPYMREASYICSVYPQIYLDFGLAVPKLSIRGMQSTISQLVELAPLNKIMFSTDGYAFPETFYLGAKWTREILTSVLSEACESGDLAFEEAILYAHGILRGNALNLYKLDDGSATGRKRDELSLTREDGLCLSQIREKGRQVFLEETQRDGTETNGYAASVFQNHGTRVRKEVANSNVAAAGSEPSDSANSQSVKHVRLLWADGSGKLRSRVVPAERFKKVTVSYGVGLTQCCMGMSSHSDGPSEGCGLTAVGEIRLIPDLSTKYQLPWFSEHEVVLVDMHLDRGRPWQYCPRSTLQHVAGILDREFGLVARAGFEKEFYLLKPSHKKSPKWKGVDSTLYCSSAAFDAVSHVLSDICNSLKSLDVTVEQMHAEAGGGQFELSIEHSPSSSAADKVLFVRETVKAVSKKHGLLATFTPKYFPGDAGSGSHVHISLWQGGKNVFMGDTGSRYGMSKIGEEFLAGVLHHLPAVLAFTAPHPNSYARIQPNTWSGAYQCWGKDNREAPLRTASPPGVSADVVSNFELKSFDGCSNPHLGLAAIIAAGIDGLRKHLQLPDPTEVNPAMLPEGSLPKMPSSLEEAVAALSQDEALNEILGVPLVTAISAIRKTKKMYKNCWSSNISYHLD